MWCNNVSLSVHQPSGTKFCLFSLQDVQLSSRFIHIGLPSAGVCDHTMTTSFILPITLWPSHSASSQVWILAQVAYLVSLLINNFYSDKSKWKWLNLLFCVFCVCIFKDPRWWLTMQCAASSLSSGTSNSAWLNSSSRAVGLVQGSHSRHFWINSYKKTNIWVTHFQNKRLVGANVTFKQTLATRDLSGNTRSTLCSSPSAVGPPVTGWHCWWPPEKIKRTLHCRGFPTEPSATHQTCERIEERTRTISSCALGHRSPLRHTCQTSRCLQPWWHQQLKWEKEYK